MKPDRTAQAAASAPSQVRHLAHIDWVDRSLRDAHDGVASCVYRSSSEGPAPAQGRQVLLTSTRSVPVVTQFDTLRRTKPPSTGGRVQDLLLAGLPAVRYTDPGGRLCQVMVMTGEDSTITTLVNDPTGAMANDCDLVERLEAGLVAPVL